MNISFLLLAGAAIASPSSPPQAMLAQQGSMPLTNVGGETQSPATQLQTVEVPGAVPEDAGDEEEILIKGQLPRGSVVGDIPPVSTLDTREVRATGASSVSELLDAIAPQIGSVRGRGGEQPVLLLDGQRVSSFRELRDIPTEAILRVDILPDEVALNYGYNADQKVVNIVLRRRFRSTKAEIAGGGATDGGYVSANGALTRFLVLRNGRTMLNVRALVNSMLTEAERDIILDQGPLVGTTEQQLAARSLIGSKRDIRASGTFNRQLSKTVSGTLNTEIEHLDGRSLIGLNPALLEPLVRNMYSDTAHAGLSLNGQTRRHWRWAVTGNADIADVLTKSDRVGSSFQRDRAHETSDSGDLTATANGNLFTVPAGYASATLTAGGKIDHLNGSRTRLAASSSRSFTRTASRAAISIDLPISRRGRDFSALGNLTFNGNAEVDHLSDFGTLSTIGAGIYWSPVDRLNLVASWTHEDEAPSINQLGDPVLDTPGSRVFDFTTGQTALVDAVTGGNPELKTDSRSVVILSSNWQPFKNVDLRLRADYAHQIIARPISSIMVSPQIEAAFPNRFVRDSSGELVSVDLTPINFDRSRRDQLRVGVDFTTHLQSYQPSKSALDQMRALFGVGSRGQQGASGAAAAGGHPSDDIPRGGRGSDIGRSAFGGAGGSRRGRVQFSLTDTITFVDTVRIAPGGAELDYLHGDAAGSSGGTPRHYIQAQLGYFNNGLGGRIGANWRSGTSVNTLTGNNLHFSPVGTFDLRLFANPGDIPEIVVLHPWLRGTQVRVELNNVFNVRPEVHDAAGNVPLSYQPDLLDPLGRTIMISFRKLFQPTQAIRRQLQQEPDPTQRQQEQPSH